MTNLLEDRSASQPGELPAEAPRGAVAPRTGVASWLQRPLVGCLLLLACYGALSMLDDPRGVLGADSGGKLATLRVMGERETLDPDVGYWAAADDPSGSLHPLYYTRAVGDRWVQATTLPMLDLALPLYELGGLRAVLLLPMFGALLAALAARALARRLGGNGWVAFWAIGLATPVAIYALDFWEHALGLGLVAWALVLSYDLVRRRAGWRLAFVAGALFGAAAALRTEALVYFFVAAAAVVGARILADRGVRGAFTTGLSLVAGAGVVLIANELLEIMVAGQGLRAGRAAGTAVDAGSGLTSRLQEAATTAIGFNGFPPSTEVVLGICVVLLIGGGAWMLSAPSRSNVLGGACIGIAALPYAIRLTAGLGYLPGVLVASPLAAAGIVVGWRARSLRWPLVVGATALPLVWIAQYSGNMRPQWGGRYVLVSGLLFAVVAVVALRNAPVALTAVIVLSLVVTGWGVVLLSERSHRIAEGMETLVARHDAALVSMEAHLLREGGAFYDPARHWLTATDDGALERAARIVAGVGDREMAVVAPLGKPLPARLGGWDRADSLQRVEVRLGEQLEVVTYTLT